MAKIVVEVSCIRLRIVLVQEIAIIVGCRRHQLGKAKIAFNDQASLSPFISPEFVGKFDRAQVTYRWVIIAIAVSFKVLVIGA